MSTLRSSSPGGTNGSEAWISTFEAALRPLPDPERADIVAELRTHLQESGEAPDAAFGEPLAYARRFLSHTQDAPQDQAAPSLLRWAARLLVLPVAIVVQLIGLVLLGTIYLEVVQPQDTGLFMEGTQVTGFGLDTNPSPATEVLGAWLIPLCLVTGIPLSYIGLRLFDWIRTP